MAGYEVIITPAAQKDLRELKQYWVMVMDETDSVRSRIQMLRVAFSSLRELPERGPLVTLEPWHSRGIRKLIVKNLLAYYRVDNKTQRVYILNVVYGKRDQMPILRRI